MRAEDGALIFELLNPRQSGISKMSIAEGTVKPRGIARPHFHKRSEEVYYILEGTDMLGGGEKHYCVKKGDVVFIQNKKVHALENISRKNELRVLAISAPAYSSRDIFFE